MIVIVTTGNVTNLTQNTLLWLCIHTTLIKPRVVTMLLLADKTAGAMTGLCRCAWPGRLCMICTHLGVWPTQNILEAVRLQGVMVIQPV